MYIYIWLFKNPINYSILSIHTYSISLPHILPWQVVADRVKNDASYDVWNT